MAYKIGYAHVSTKEQNLNTQIDKLKEAGCKKIFCDKGSRASNSRKEPRQAFDHIHHNEGTFLSLVEWVDCYAAIKTLLTSLRK